MIEPIEEYERPLEQNDVTLLITVIAILVLACMHVYQRPPNHAPRAA